jgi:putative transposase
MKFELVRSSHSVGEANLHLVFTPAYRRAIFADEPTRVLTRDYFLAQARRKGFTISAIGFGNDHVHMFVTGFKNFNIARLAQLLKGFTSIMMRRHHFEFFRARLWKKKFWSAGYFYRTVGAVNSFTVKRYVEQSQEYSFKGSDLSVAKKQKKLMEFSF